MKRHSAESLAAVTDPILRRLLGQIRRAAIDTTAKMKWKVLAYLLPGDVRESFEAEVYPGVGFYARPPSSGRAESIVLFVGGAGQPAIVATRDEATRKAKAGDLAADETAMFNSQAIIRIKSDGTIHITGGKVFLGDGTFVEATEGVVNGEATDTNTGLSQWELGNASGKVFAKK